MRNENRTAVAPRSILHDEVSESDPKDSKGHDVFRQYFEERFEPLKIEPLQTTQNPVSESLEVGNETDTSGWDGLSDKGESTTEIYEHEQSVGLCATSSQEPEVVVFMVRPCRSAHSNGFSNKAIDA